MRQESFHSDNGLIRRALTTLAFSCLFSMALFALSGCVFSETITERIIDNNPDSIIDPELEPILINTITATETTDKLPRLDIEEETEEQQDEEEVLPDFTDVEELATTTTAAPTPQRNDSASANGAVASSPSRTTISTTEVSPQEDGDAVDDGFSDVGGNGDEGDSQDTGDEESDDSQDSSEDGPGEADDGSGRESGGSGDYYDEAPDMENPEIPENINEVVAFGNNAVIVSILAGNDSGSALLACDDATKSQTSTVLAARGMGSVAGLACSVGQGMPDAAFDVLTNQVKPDLVFVTEGENPFSDAQKTTLARKRITVYTLPALTSDTRIKFTFEVITQMLEQGGVAGVRDRCNAYLGLRESIINTYQNANGGLTGGFDFEEGRAVDTSASTLVTLVIDRWEEGARYNDSYGILDSSTGAAAATLGYSTSPVNYYLSVGGVLNNAASTKVLNHTNTGKALVWQFSQNLINGDQRNWSGLSGRYTSLSGGGFSGSLLCYTSDYYGLGSPEFPAVIVKSQRLQGLMNSSASNPRGLYYAYGNIAPAGHGNTIGYFVGEDTSFYVESCIGRGTSSTSILGEGGLYGIYVNPKGLCQASADDGLCSWLAGSPESVLEASWAHWMFRGGSQASFEQDVASFYQTCYGYTPSSSDLMAIEAGAVQ